MVSNITISNRRLRMRQLVLFLVMASACCAQLFDQVPANQRSQNNLFTRRRNSSNKGRFILQLPENANSAACLSSQGPRIRSDHRGFCHSRIPILRSIAGRITIFRIRKHKGIRLFRYRAISRATGCERPEALPDY